MDCDPQYPPYTQHTLVDDQNNNNSHKNRNSSLDAQYVMDEVESANAIQAGKTIDNEPRSSDEEYWSAEESFTDETSSLSPSPPSTEISAQGDDSDEDYWSNVPDFDFEDDALTSLLSYGSEDPDHSSSFYAANSGPSTAAPSTLFHLGTSQSLAAHPMMPASSPRRKYYAVTKGRWTGVFDNWNMAKAAVDGVNGTHQSFDTLEEAWRVYIDCQNLGLLQLAH